MFIDPLGLKDVMVRSIAEKNGGTATSKQNILGVTKSVTVQIGDITKTYSVGDNKNQVRIVEGRAVIDSSVIKKDFALSYDESRHLEGDLFNSEGEAAMAFGLMYHETSLNEEQEYGAGLYQTEDGKWYFDNVSNSADYAGKALEDLTREERNACGVPIDTNTTIHTHWEKWGNLEQSRTDNTNAMLVARTTGYYRSYIVNYSGRINYKTYSENSIYIGAPSSKELANIGKGV